MKQAVATSTKKYTAGALALALLTMPLTSCVLLGDRCSDAPAKSLVSEIPGYTVGKGPAHFEFYFSPRCAISRASYTRLFELLRQYDPDGSKLTITLVPVTLKNTEAEISENAAILHKFGKSTTSSAASLLFQSSNWQTSAPKELGTNFTDSDRTLARLADKRAETNGVQMVPAARGVNVAPDKTIRSVLGLALEAE